MINSGYWYGKWTIYRWFIDWTVYRWFIDDENDDLAIEESWCSKKLRQITEGHLMWMVLRGLGRWSAQMRIAKPIDIKMPVLESFWLWHVKNSSLFEFLLLFWRLPPSPAGLQKDLLHLWGNPRLLVFRNDTSRKCNPFFAKIEMGIFTKLNHQKWWHRPS